MRFTALSIAALLLTLTGCHSPYVDATVQNATARPISPV